MLTERWMPSLEVPMCLAKLRQLVAVLPVPLVVGLGCSSGELTHGGNGDGGVPPIEGLRAITVEPANQTLNIVGTMAATSQYRAMGEFNDGHREDVSTRVQF